MMTSRRIRQHLQASPFRPFRIFLSDGLHHDVPHPEFAWLVGSRLYVAWIVKEWGPEDPAVKELANLHISRIEPLDKPKARARRK